MGLVDNQIVPVYFLQIFYGCADGLVTGNYHIEFTWCDYGETDLSLFFGSFEFERSKGGQPFSELGNPVSEGDFGGDDDVGSWHILKLFQEGQHWYSLNCFAQPHIVCQNAADSALVKADHPVECDQLVVFELSSFENWGLIAQSD